MLGLSSLPDFGGGITSSGLLVLMRCQSSLFSNAGHDGGPCWVRFEHPFLGIEAKARFARSASAPWQARQLSEIGRTSRLNRTPLSAALEETQRKPESEREARIAGVSGKMWPPEDEREPSDFFMSLRRHSDDAVWLRGSQEFSNPNLSVSHQCLP